MVLTTFASIRDFASKKPFRFQGTATHAALGVFNDTIISPSSITTYQITQCMFYFSAGTMSSSFNWSIWDGANAYYFIAQPAPVLNTTYMYSINVPVESADVVRISANVTAQPFTYYYAMFGWIQQRGEGSLD
jgi:hypothetical protein